VIDPCRPDCLLAKEGSDLCGFPDCLSEEEQQQLADEVEAALLGDYPPEVPL